MRLDPPLLQPAPDQPRKHQPELLSTREPQPAEPGIVPIDVLGQVPPEARRHGVRLLDMRRDIGALVHEHESQLPPRREHFAEVGEAAVRARGVEGVFEVFASEGVADFADQVLVALAVVDDHVPVVRLDQRPDELGALARDADQGMHVDQFGQFDRVSAHRPRRAVDDQWLLHVCRHRRPRSSGNLQHPKEADRRHQSPHRHRRRGLEAHIVPEMERRPVPRQSVFGETSPRCTELVERSHAVSDVEIVHVAPDRVDYSRDVVAAVGECGNGFEEPRRHLPVFRVGARNDHLD